MVGPSPGGVEGWLGSRARSCLVAVFLYRPSFLPGKPKKSAYVWIHLGPEEPFLRLEVLRALQNLQRPQKIVSVNVLAWLCLGSPFLCSTYQRAIEGTYEQGGAGGTLSWVHSHM